MSPLETPSTWRYFLYDEILVPWEIGSVHVRSEVYSAKAIPNALGLLVLKKNNKSEMCVAEREYRHHIGEFLVYYSDGRGYEELFKRLRDTVAHANFTPGRTGWIKMNHRFQGRDEAQPNVRLIASMKFQTLRRLVRFISPS